MQLVLSVGSCQILVRSIEKLLNGYLDICEVLPNWASHLEMGSPCLLVTRTQIWREIRTT